ncbi:hypothetical protein C1646_763433 [Rhizophagus diaphanus]|nr:hypothetical protein C1646_763433 [Rhizophagus diaphanus] [Rhizophagus sp. MUCL 43196]
MTFDGIEKPKNRAFVMKNCELINNAIEPTQEFIKVVIDAIESENPVEEFKQITKEYGQFIPGKVILGGRVLFDKNISSGYFTENSSNSNYLKGKSTSYKYNCTKIIGGKHPDNENFDEIAWFKTLKDYRNWKPIEFQNPVSIFQFLPIDLRRRISITFGKRILYMATEEHNYRIEEFEKPEIFKFNMPANILKMIQNKEEYNIFATVCDMLKLSNDIFTCQVLYPSDGEPSLIIHCIQKKYNRRQCRLKIGWMIIGHCTDLSSILLDSDIQLKVLRNDFASNNQEMTQYLLNCTYDYFPICLGIPVLKKSCYAKLPDFTFYTLVNLKCNDLNISEIPLERKELNIKCVFLNRRTTCVIINPYTRDINQEVIERLKLNYGLHLDEQPSEQANNVGDGQLSRRDIFVEDDESNISLCHGQPSERAILVDDGKLTISLYNRQPIIYFDLNNSDFSNTLQSTELCINFPIAEITYKSQLSEAFSKYTNNDENLHKLYGHFFARKILIGSKVFIKNQDSTTSTQMDILKFYLFQAYNKVKYSIEIQFNDLFALNTLPKMEILDKAKLNTYDKLIEWMKNLNGTLDSIKNYDNIQIKEKLSLKDWVGKATYDNNKEIVISFIEIPKIILSDKSYLKIIKPSTKLEFSLISNNIYSIKNFDSFPFIRSNVEFYEDFNCILVKCERCEILLDNVNPTKEFEQIIEKALESMKPLKDLQHIFNEYGESVKKDNLSQWIDDTKDNLEIIEFDNIIPLYKILKMEQQKKIEDVLNKFNDHTRIIMTGITDLKDLDNDNVLHYKCIDLEISLEDKNYEVFGSIISENNVRLDNIYVNFGLYDFNGFYAITKKSEISNIDLCFMDDRWETLTINSFSPNNRDLQVNYFKESIKLQSNQLNYFIVYVLCKHRTFFVYVIQSLSNHVIHTFSLLYT